MDNPMEVRLPRSTTIRSGSVLMGWDSFQGARRSWGSVLMLTIFFVSIFLSVLCFIEVIVIEFANSLKDAVYMRFR